ncbi:MAG: helix-turn-helix domain-containing protein [Oscillospiraceae bacterium]|nr:helix-turn-helix domain-containing protein [Oscillospiraceae bacterium]
MLEDNMILGENAKRARESCGFSQANVAEFLNVDQSLISKFEKGLRSLQSDMLERLANLYGNKVTDFFCTEGIPEQRIKTAYRSSGITTDDMEAIHDIRRIALNLFFMSDLASGDQRER